MKKSLANWLRGLLGIFGGTSLYGLAGFAVAGPVALLVKLFTSADIATPVVVLLVFPLAPFLLYLRDCSEKHFRRRLQYLKELYDEGLITKGNYVDCRRAALRWYAERMFGRAGVELPPEE